MMRYCPNCESERELGEMLCEGTREGAACGWDLSVIPIRSPGWRPSEPAHVAATVVDPTPLACPNGHAVGLGDLLCETCGADLEGEILPAEATTVEATVIGEWRLERQLTSAGQVRERYIAVRQSDDHAALLTLYAPGLEPDPDIYDALRGLSRDHVPELIETGRWQDRAYEVSEELRGGTLAELGLLADDLPTLSRVVQELGGALTAFGECGLRHRDLKPGAILVRARDPLDLVVTGFGSARLSEFDLDIVSPLETTRYTAPEAIAGGVAAASDWWSLGMVLLEQVTRGACFEGINDQAFLIHVLTQGAPIPEGLDPSLDLLLRGLLALDRRERWAWAQVRQWLAGEAPPAPARTGMPESGQARRTIRLAGRPYGHAAAFALAAAQAERWDEARELLLIGAVATWADEAKFDASLQAELRQLAQIEAVSEDMRLALALKALNPAMPLVSRGEIVTPGWLLDHIEEGYALVSGPVPALLERTGDEPWLSRLANRAVKLRERARQLDVALNENELRVHLLSTSRSRLAAIWADRRRLLPDTDHPGLVAILERRQTEDEDFILLLSADVGQFRTADAIVAEAAEIAARAGLDEFSAEEASAWLERPRREIHAAIETRLEGFARCGRDRIDEWADQFRLERRLPIARALVLLGVAIAHWSAPPKQTYVATLLDFFARRITGAVMRGPLTRMVIGKTTARLDLAELGSERRPAAQLLDHLLLRNDQKIELDPGVLIADPRVERRIRTLYSHATLYRRDTGIDGLYLGFPFLLMQETRTTTRPRIAPILLWPIKLSPEVGARGSISLSFDRDREEVRLNPAFETLLGPEAAQRWGDAARDMLGRASLSAADVVDAFSGLAAVQTRTLAPLPSKDANVRAGDDQLVCAGALFHLAYIGQAVMEDLRQLKAIPPSGTSLETALRVAEPLERPEPQRGRELDRFFTAASDPSQEAAVLEAREGRGLLIEGPPGTGKSQTIVNMVADAIGRQKSLLIVCQKQAALEVVHKRLEAEGLGDRIVMVNDVNKDRRAVIQAIRDQLDALWSRPAGSLAWRQQRHQLAARIESLEADLDQHHAALHAHDSATGLSYRLVLADLIGFERDDRPAIDVPALRAQLGPLDVGEIATLQEVCGPIARLWLPAQYENSALAVLKPFGADSGTVAVVEDGFERFRAAEATRADVIARTPEAFPITDPAPYRAWSNHHAATFLGLDDTARERLARWLPLQWPGEQDERRAQILSDIAETLGALDGLTAVPDANASAVTVTLDEEALAEWTGLAITIAQRPGFFARLSPIRWWRARRLRRFLGEHGLNDPEQFGRAGHAEQALRPWRARVSSIDESLREPAETLSALGPTDLAARLRALEVRLRDSEALVLRLAAHPAAAARATALAGTREAVVDLLDAAEQGSARHAARCVSSDALEALDPWFGDAWTVARSDEIARDTGSADAVEPVAAALPTLGAYQRFRARVEQLDDQAVMIFRRLRTIEVALAALPANELDGEVRRIIGRESRLAWKGRLEGANPALQFETTELKAKAEALAQADVDMRQLNRRLLIDGVDATQLRPAREWEDITRLTGQRARRLREFLDRGADLGLMALRPIWLMNPDVASRVLPLKRALFDSVVYDEASQMPIEYALPTLFRSAKMVVSGDEKQMPPTAFFTSRVESDEAELFEGHDQDEIADEEERDAVAETWNRREIKDCPDLLQLAKTVLPTTTLQIHYRSAYRELIQFSNASFYINRLSVPARHPETEIRRVRPIELIRVDGVYEDQTNPAEAERVADVLKRFWEGPVAGRKSVGVVTFNRKQADLIEEVLEAHAERDPAFRAAITQERDRIDHGEDMGFFVKNVENVQGDERDVIIFSSTFGRNAQGTFRRAFGVLGQAGGERRLNVAVTRAREKVVLVTSMPIAQISDLLGTRRQASSPRDFLQAYFEYARALSEGELDNAQALLARLVSERRERGAASDERLDGFEAAVAAEIAALGWRAVQVDDSGAFGLDFAIEDPRTGLYGIGIECDAPRHALLRTARAREMWRPSVLRRSIPVVHRVASHGWFHSPDEEKARLADAISQAMGRVAA